MKDIKKFQEVIRGYYRDHKRDLPWRKTRNPYKILVSEVMLQQTQVSRVLPKYRSFLRKFPTTGVLAEAKTRDVLTEWQGLGYNRRALYLKQCAQKIENDHKGKFPKELKALCALPGIGPTTAGDIMAFAWNMPAVVIETNIRSVFIHFFFKGRKKVRDKEILPLIEKTLDPRNPREWYYALFDYGVYLKKTLNPSRRSAHHIRQSVFEGSHRQKRARILRVILGNQEKPLTETKLQNISGYEAELLSKILSALVEEGFVARIKTKDKKRIYYTIA